MTDSMCEVSRCGLCRFYNHEGHRGGRCSQLSVPVDSQWQSCCLALSPFLAKDLPQEKRSAGIADDMSDWMVSSAVSASTLSARVIASSSLRPAVVS